MKIALLLLTCLLPLSVSAQIYPWRPTAYTYGFQTNATAAQARSYLGIGTSLTNYGATVTNWTAYGTTLAGNTTNSAATASTIAVYDANKVLGSGTTTANLATLSANQTFTGTNTFPPASFYPANNIGMRLLWSSPTNYFFSSIATNSGPTNNGGFAATTFVGEITVPALLGSNSSLWADSVIIRSVNVIGGSLYFFVGTNTNFVCSVANFPAPNVGISTVSLPVLHNAASFTAQVQGVSGVVIPSVTNYVNTAEPFILRFGLASAGQCTNVFFYQPENI